MPQDSVYKGAKSLLRTILRNAIPPDQCQSVSPENPCFPASYDLGPTRVVVPSSPPAWIPHDLPILLPVDEPSVDPRTVLPSCPLDSMIRAINVISPSLALRDFDIITDRKNLRALFNFFKDKNRQSHRIDAELIGDTLLFYLGWSEWGYNSLSRGYGTNFERKFTSSLSEGTIQHNRVISYSFGGLKVMVKYQVDACLSASTLAGPQSIPSPAFTTASGLDFVLSGTMVPSESIVEIKTMREGSGPLKPQTMEQLWFSQTPILITGYHNGNGLFSFVKATAMEEQLQLWENKNTLVLRKVISVLKMIRECLSHSPVKRQAIVLNNKGNFAQIEFFSVDDEEKISLPEDLRQIWKAT
ncbi:hypothetical protein H0H92_006165 [Tricholoma furcatifolium]|nr:hypothetical protein H0H92_006165 [Tricholoma furcatifolium]